MPIDWVGQMPNAMISVILVGAWKYFPFVVISVLARLQTIPDHLYEAATMDGAGAWGRFFDITLPQLREVLFIVILLRAIWDFKEFDLIYLLTGGGPVTSTQTLPLLVYKQAFALNEMGGASAVAVLMMLFMLGFMIALLPLRPADGELSDEAVRPVASPVQPLRLDDRGRRVVPADLDDRHLAQAADRAVPHPAQPAAGQRHLRALSTSSCSSTKFLTYFGNSVIVSVATTVLVIVVGVLGAHSLVRFSYPGRERLAQLVLFTYLLPSVVLIIPLYLMLVSLGLANTLFSLTIAYTTFALPFALWLLRSFMAGIPQDLEAAAMVDGASRMGAFFDVILPQALPGIISTAVFTFILAWNEYLYRPGAGEPGLRAHADDRRHHHAGHVLPHRMVDADGRLGDDERAGDRRLRLPAEAPDPRLRRGRRQGLSASWPR